MEKRLLTILLSIIFFIGAALFKIEELLGAIYAGIGFFVVSWGAFAMQFDRVGFKSILNPFLGTSDKLSSVEVQILSIGLAMILGPLFMMLILGVYGYIRF